VYTLVGLWIGRLTYYEWLLLITSVHVGTYKKGQAFLAALRTFDMVIFHRQVSFDNRLSYRAELIL
jgi:hypothetical protein